MSTLLVTDVAWVHGLPLLAAVFVLFRMWYLRNLVSCPNSIYAGVVLSLFYVLIQTNFVYHEVYLYFLLHGIKYADMSSILFSLWEAVMLLSYERAVSFCVTTGNCRNIEYQDRCVDDVAYDEQKQRDDHVLTYDDKAGCITKKKITK